MGRRSLAADTRKIATEQRATNAKAMPVLRFHCGGLGHQPPDGAQTCFEKSIEINNTVRFCESLEM